MDDIEKTLARMDERIKAGDSQMALAKTAYLSQEQETAPFLLFLMGDSLEEIADKTNYPKEILAVTAKQYGWIARKDAFAKEGRSVPAEIQKNLVNSLLVATYIAVQQELSLVMRGERDPAQTKFVPKNIGALQTLIQMVNTVNNIENKTKAPTIKGNNVQVNFGPGEAQPSVPQTKEELLRAMADQAEPPRRKSDE